MRRERTKLQDTAKQLEERIGQLEAELHGWEREREQFYKKNPRVTVSPGREARIKNLDDNIAALRDRRDALITGAEALAQEAERLSGVPGSEAAFEDYRYEDLGKKRICFPAGTLVHTPDGVERIEKLAPGRLVSSHNPADGTPATSCVVAVLRSWTRQLTVVELDQQGDDNDAATLLATPPHPFWVETDAAPERGTWCPAGKLRPGDRLRTVDGDMVKVRRVGVRSAVLATYNLEVAETHTYFTGARGVLVHNGGESKWARTNRQVTRIYAIVEKSTATVIYVGKTFQGESGNVVTRFTGHKSTKPSWRARAADLEPVMLQEGNWTEYETACWEQHYINEFGGPRSDNPQSHLENDINAISREQFNAYKEGYGHNPCAG